MVWGKQPTDGGNFVLSALEKLQLCQRVPKVSNLIRSYVGSAELIRGLQRFCLWIEDQDLELAREIPEVRNRIHATRDFRERSKAETRKSAAYPHRFRQIRDVAEKMSIAIAGVSSERREYLPLCHYSRMIRY